MKAIYKTKLFGVLDILPLANDPNKGTILLIEEGCPQVIDVSSEDPELLLDPSDLEVATFVHGYAQGRV